MLDQATPSYILAFDHRAALRAAFAQPGESAQDQRARFVASKHIVLAGLMSALAHMPRDSVGVLVDEEYGAEVAREAREQGLLLAMPVERSLHPVFELAYGDDFAAHVDAFRPDLVKALVSYNPDGDAELNTLQRSRLGQLVGWLRDAGYPFMLEVLVPPTPEQLELVDGDAHRYDVDLRPELTRRAVEVLQESGVLPQVWKLEGLDREADCAMVARQCRAAGGEEVSCLVLGRGADQQRVQHWLEVAAPTPGFSGFAIGRSIWEEPLRQLYSGALDEPKASARIGDTFRHFVSVYETARAVGP